MNVFYKANVTDGLFNDVWFMKDGTPTGGKSSPVAILTTIFSMISFLGQLTSLSGQLLTADTSTF